MIDGLELTYEEYQAFQSEANSFFSLDHLPIARAMRKIAKSLHEPAWASEREQR